MLVEFGHKRGGAAGFGCHRFGDFLQYNGIRPSPTYAAPPHLPRRTAPGSTGACLIRCLAAHEGDPWVFD
jgi:hypothetical protein